MTSTRYTTAGTVGTFEFFAHGLTLRSAVADHPGRRAGDLAQMLGRDTRTFKLDVRKLKALGLTISLETGYRLSPRGEAFLARVGSEATE